MSNVSGTDLQRKLENKHVTTLKDWFNQDDFKRKLLSVLPKVINRDAFITNAYNIYANDTKLQECSIKSFLNALMQAAKVGLIPNSPLGHCFIIPYKKEATFQMGYPGYIELALRTDKYESIYAHEVYPQDEFKACYGLHKDLIHIPSENPIPEGTKPTHYYAVYKLANGGYDFVYWTRDKVLKHRDRFSSGYRSAKRNNYESTWETDEEFMGRKTMVIQVLKMAPKSTEMVYALSTEPGEEGRKNMFPEEMDITPQADAVHNDLPTDKPEKVKQKAEKEESKEDTDTYSVNDNQVSVEDLEEIAKAAGYDNWKAIIIEGCRIKASGKPVFDASVNEKEAKDILQNDKNRFSVLYEHFNRIIDQQHVKAGKS